jgi:4-amino-4-deoxy-L-arabinose transferase-like glycosyltransferase
MEPCTSSEERSGGLAASAASLTEAVWADALLMGATAILVFWGLGVRGLWAAEGRWAEVTREMFLRGDFFHPTIGGEPYFDKPLLTYWLRAALSALTGTLDELIVRLPSAMAAVAAVWATARIGARLWSARTGRIAGWLLLTTYAFLFWARTGTADAENLAAVVLAVAWYWSRRDRPGFGAMLVFYLIAFVGALTKGLTAVCVPIAVVLPDMLTEKRWRVLLTLRHFAALGIAAAVYLCPFVYAALTRPAEYSSSGLALVFQENVLRFFEPIDHKGPIYLYVYQLPALLLPWTPIFVLAVVGAVKARRELDSHTRWLVWAIVLVFVFFTLSGSRRSYYILPILPFCGLLMAVFVAQRLPPQLKDLRRRVLEIQRILLIAVVAFDLAIPLILVILRKRIGFEVTISLGAASLTIGLAAQLLAMLVERMRGRAESSGADGPAIEPLIATAVVLLGGYFCWQQGILEVNRTERLFAEQVKELAAALPPERVAMFPKSNANVLFYLGREEPVRILQNAELVGDFIAQGQRGVVITRRRDTAALPAETANDLELCRPVRQHVQPWESEASQKEKWVAWVVGDSPGEAITTAPEKGGDHAQ